MTYEAHAFTQVTQTQKEPWINKNVLYLEKGHIYLIVVPIWTASVLIPTSVPRLPHLPQRRDPARAQVTD